MPPPTAGDPWLAGRHFGAVIDAGSSGSRLQIYSWKDPKAIRLDKTSEFYNSHTLPRIEKGTKQGEEWVSKVEPGISSFADNLEDLPGHLRPLLNHAREHIPPSLHAETPLFLLATAGMRLLLPEKQAEILSETCRFFVHHSHFRLDGPTAAGPCGSSVRIITGEEEGLFGWIAVNYLMDGFTGTSNPTTYGFLDMGGASTQIAFEPSKAHQDSAKSLIEVRLRLLDGEEILHKVFVTTWLGYGTNQARERYVGQAINEFEAQRTSPLDRDVVPDPCLPKDLELTETPVHLGLASDHSKKTHRLVGTGSFEQCMRKTAALLNKHAPCPDTPCLMNGVYVPPIDFSVSHFIGVSEYWYSSEHVFGLGGPYDFVQYERAASQFCSRNWSNIVEEHEESRQHSRPTGDGEVEDGGRIVDVGKWGDKVEIPRLQMQCFKAAWIANVLHDGIGMPRIVDPGGNGTTYGERVAEQAESKGLGRPTFQSVDTVGDIAISWTLGKMVLEASKEVPLLSKADKPLVDPLDDIPNPETFPIKPIRPPFLDIIEDKISPHLPTSLTRSSLGFSPVLLLFYPMLFLMLLFVIRRRVRSSCLRLRRNKAKQRDAEAYNMGEEGKPLTAGSRPPSPTLKCQKWLRPLRGIFPFVHRPPNPSIISSPPSNSNLRVAPPRISPTRSFSMPNGLTSAASISRSPSPSPGLVDDNYFSNGLYSRSLNTSQLNLSGGGVIPRPGAISRINSMHHITDMHLDE
ncbi:nucleoside-diphosphatase [Armillaria nabsnona]|nr:nucleoside-diphosphatase [Armillaria nabsnona]